MCGERDKKLEEAINQIWKKVLKLGRTITCKDYDVAGALVRQFIRDVKKIKDDALSEC